MMANAARLSKNESRATEFYSIADSMASKFVNAPDFSTPCTESVPALHSLILD